MRRASRTVRDIVVALAVLHRGGRGAGNNARQLSRFSATTPTNRYGNAGDGAARTARIGYGWLWYQGRGFVLRGAADARDLHHRSSRGGYLPPILPGVHPQRVWLLGRLGYGLRAEFTELFTKLTFDPTQSDRGDVTARRGDLAFSLVFGW